MSSKKRSVSTRMYSCHHSRSHQTTGGTVLVDSTNLPEPERAYQEPELSEPEPFLRLRRYKQLSHRQSCSKQAPSPPRLRDQHSRARLPQLQRTQALELPLRAAF